MTLKRWMRGKACARRMATTPARQWTDARPSTCFASATWIVVADWRMPVMSGSVLCYHVRNEQSLAEIVFILVSGEPSPPAFVYYDGFLRKPLDPSELLSAMDRLLLERAADGRRRRHHASAPRN